MTTSTADTSMVTYRDEDTAWKVMILRNNTRSEDWVIVEGPDGGEFTVMTMTDAVDGRLRLHVRSLTT